MGVQIPPPLPDFGCEDLWASGKPLGWSETDMGNEVTVRKEKAEDGRIEQARSYWQQFQQYAYEVRTETRRVTWPGKQEIYGTTIMVILTTFLFGFYFAICDKTFGYVVKNLLSYLRHR
jgi:preprotein translocase SecE subunit